MNRLILIGLLLSSTLVPVEWAAASGDDDGISPFETWKTIETPHFRITFAAGLEEVAIKVADYYEESHRLLAPFMQWEARYRVQVTLLDNTDAHNGSTSAQNRTGMVLFVTPPTNTSTLYHYDDWLKILVIHEYTHFLNLDPTTGVWEGIRWVLGDSVRPNVFWPAWMLEGFAVYVETLYSEGGRGRSTYYEALLRAMVEESVLDQPDYVDFDRIQGSTPIFPAGQNPYFFGYYLFNQAGSSAPAMSQDGLDRLGGPMDLFGTMSIRSSERFPFLIDDNLQNLTGKYWKDHWDGWVAQTRIRMTRQLDQIRLQRVTKFEKITTDGSMALGVAVSPDGKWLAYTHASPDEITSLYLRNLQTNETTKLLRKSGGIGVAFNPDSNYIVYSSFKQEHNYNNFQELYSWNIETGENRLLTENARVKDPDFSPDGKKLVFSVVDHARVGIGLADVTHIDGRLEISGVQTIYLPDRFDVASTPRFSPDGSSVYFSFHKNGERSEKIVRLNLESKELVVLIDDGNFSRFPVFDRTGNLYFVSDATGVDNLYRYRQGGQIELLTNFTTALWCPVAVPAVPGAQRDSRVFYGSVLNPRGFDLVRFDVAGELEPTGAPLAAPAAPPLAQPGFNTERSGASYSIKSYRPFSTILPRTWRPSIAYSDVAGFRAGARFSGYDALDFHRYSFSARHFFALGSLEAAASYSNRSLGPTLTASIGENVSNVALNPTSQVRMYSKSFDVSIAASYPFISTYSRLTPLLQLGLGRGYSGQTNVPVLVAGSRIPTVKLQADYSDGWESPLAVTNEGGRSFTVAAKTYFPVYGTTTKLFVSDVEHFRLWDHLVLSPGAAVAWASNKNALSSANVNVYGTPLEDFINQTFSPHSVDGLYLRGYNIAVGSIRGAAVGTLDLRAPLWRIYSGIDTAPLFFKDMVGFTFFESGIFPGKEPGAVWLPAWGLGVTLNSVVLVRSPLSFTIQYQGGLRSDLGGQSQLLISLTTIEIPI